MEDEILIIKTKILYFLADNNIKVNKTNLKKLKTNDLSKKINVHHIGYIQLAIDELLPKRSKKQILKDIDTIELKRIEFVKKPRVSSGSYSQSMTNFNIRIKILKNELLKI